MDNDETNGLGLGPFFDSEKVDAPLQDDSADEVRSSSHGSDGFGIRDPVEEIIRESQSSSIGPIHSQNIDNQMAKAVDLEWQSLVSSSLTRPDNPALKFPWERGFAGRVLSPQSPLASIRLPIPAFIPSFQELAQTAATSSGPQEKPDSAVQAAMASHPASWKMVSKRIEGLTFNQSESSKRQIALTRWKSIVAESPAHSRLGRKLLSELIQFKSDGYLDRILEDVFSKKATGTLNKRGAHILEFFKYCKDCSEEPLPLSESTFYRFLTEIRAKKAPTASKSSKESIAFSEIVGLDGAKEIISSERILGLCHKLELTKRPTVQSDTLSRAEVVCLERTLGDPQAWLPDRVKAGHDLFCTFGRLRWKDSQWIESAEIDVDENGNGFLECRTLYTKTSNTAKKRTTFLPVVVPLNLLETSNWAEKWLQVRERSGLPEIGSRDSEGFMLPAMPNIDHNGNWSNTPLSASDASKWLRELVSKGPHAPTVQSGKSRRPRGNLSSHGLKATTLSWISKHGSATPYERKILGYHVDPQDGSMHVYSRDAVSGPIRKLITVIEDVSFGIFDPDSTRSGYFSKPEAKTGQSSVEESPNEDWVLPARPALHEFDPTPRLGHELEAENSAGKKARIEDAGAGQPDSPSSGSSSSSSTANSGEEDVLLKDLLPVPKDEGEWIRRASSKLGDKRFVHVRLKTLHAGHSTEQNKLACSRTLHDGYKLYVGSEEEFSYPRCSDCFGKLRN